MEDELTVLIDQIYLCEVNIKTNSEASIANTKQPTTSYSNLIPKLVQNRGASTTLQININSNASVQSIIPANNTSQPSVPSNPYSNFLIANLPDDQSVGTASNVNENKM